MGEFGAKVAWDSPVSGRISHDPCHREILGIRSGDVTYGTMN
jgi:hypothetical protein